MIRDSHRSMDNCGIWPPLLPAPVHETFIQPFLNETVISGPAPSESWPTELQVKKFHLRHELLKIAWTRMRILSSSRLFMIPQKLIEIPTTKPQVSARAKNLREPNPELSIFRSIRISVRSCSQAPYTITSLSNPRMHYIFLGE